MTKKNTIPHEVRDIYERFLNIAFKGAPTEGLKEICTKNILLIGTGENEIFQGIKDLSAFFEKQNKELEGIPFDISRSILNSFSLAEDAYCIIESFDFISNGDPLFNARVTSNFQKVNGVWKWTHCHASTPDPNVLDDNTMPVDEWDRLKLELEQKINERTRELQIEAAVERVRVQAMSMKSSKDFSKVMQKIWEEIKELSAEGFSGASVLQFDKEFTYMYDFSSIGNIGDPNEKVVKFPHKGKKVLALPLKIWKKQKPYETFHMDFTNPKDLNAVDEEWKDIDKQIHKNFLSAIKSGKLKEQWNTFGYFPQGLIALDFLRPPDEHVKQITLKMANALALAFKRFEDLKKAEEQTREAQIELALERIRAQASAMQQSTDLLDIMVTMRTEFVKLGHEAHYFWHMKWLPDKYEKAMTSGDGTKIGMVMTLPRHIHGDIKMVAKWEKSKEPILVFPMAADQAVEYVDKMITLGDFEQVDPQAPTLDDVRAIGGLTFIMARTSHGEIGYSLPGFVENPPEEALKILVRFASTFDLAYRRFEDLKKAEAQAREAKIEASLEKVRAATMAMHGSADVGSAVIKMFDELTALGLDESVRCGIGILNRHDHFMELWNASKENETVLHFGKLDMRLHSALKNARDGWLKNQPVNFYHLKGQDIVDYYTVINNSPHYSFKFNIKNLPTERYHYDFAFNNGIIYAFTLEELSEEFIKILCRFSDLFNQTYQRYLDLTRAEAQAREAQIETALERVRSQAMAMQTSEELGKTIEVYFEQLDKLIEGKVVRAGAGLLNPENTIADITSASRSKVGDIFHVRGFVEMSGPSILHSTYEHWQKQKEYQTTLRGKEISEYYRYLSNKVAIPDNSDQDELHFYFPMFADGSIYIISETSLSEEELVVFRRFSSVISLTYRRFKDLKAAESQAREAQIEAALERVRSRTMAMQHSNELAEASHLLDKEVRNLGIKTWGCAFNIYREKDSIEWFGNEKGVLPTYTIPRKGIFKKYFDAGQKGKSFHVQEFKGQKCIDHYEYMSTLPVIGDVLRQLKKTNGSFPEYQIDHVAFFKYGYLLFITIEEVPEAHDIFKRFASLFEQTYTRFLDLQKAEAQAKESQIEAALERVRSASMAMHSSDGLLNVIQVISEQLTALGIKYNNVNFGKINQEKSYRFWISMNRWPEPIFFDVPRIKHPMIDRLEDARVKNLSLFTDTLTPKQNAKWTQHISKSKNFEFVSKKDWEKIATRPVARSSAITPNIFLVLANYKGTPYTEEQNEILVRFAKVFEQSYTRFLDLQKAETQAREAQIEAAIERVRAKSMAMHSSDQLMAVVDTIKNEIDALEVKNDGVLIYTFKNSYLKDGYDLWVAVDGVRYFKKLNVPVDNHYPQTTNIMSAINDGVDFVNEQYSKIEKDKYFKYLFKHSDLKDHTKERKAEILSASGWVRCTSVSKKCLLQFQRFSLNKFTAEEKTICSRFGKAFEQTYTRFLDLQKAEAQAREAQIEASLESVRARSMAMYHSDELGEVITLIFEKLGSLDISVGDGVALITFSEGSKDLNEWMITKGLGKAMNFHLPYFDHPVLSNLWEAKNRGEEQFSYTYSKKESKSFLKYIFEQTDFIHTPEDVKEYCLAADSYTTTFAFQKHTAIFINDYLGGSLTESELAILERFSKVFEQTYTRFLDLQKAEAQARSAQIEAAVERVRSEAMAMHHPSDLVNVTQILIKEITNIGIQGITGAAFILVDEDDIVTMWDISDPGNMGYTRDNKSVYDPREFKMLGEFWRKWKKGDEYFVIKYDLEKNKKGLEEWKLVDEENYESLKRAIEQNKLKTQWNPFGSFSKGLLTLDMMTEPDADTKKIVGKMARTFDLAYQRFDDLQKAEAQAREAKKQASLDRIRAEISAMRNQKDLETITPLIWSELSSLEVPFFRCGVFIIDENIRKVQLYLSTPNGEPIAAITMDFNSNQVADDVVANWRKQTIYKDEWNREEFVAWSKDLFEQGLIPNIKDYQHNETPPEQLYLQFVPFKQGMLYIGTDHFLGEEHMELIQDIADDFSIAYSRYEDFMNLEKAKYMAENALGELRSTQTQLVHAEKMASLGELTAGIAHEIQNPLNFVNNFSDLNRELVDELAEALENGDMEEVKELLGDLKANELKIIHHGKRAEEIVRGMLQHSRTGDGKKELTNLNALADEYLRLSYHGLRAKDKSFNADFKATLDDRIKKISIIPQDMGRVILNLINNAFHAVAEKKRASKDNYSPLVEVITVSKPESVDIIIKDNGAGIPEEIKVKIFQPFFTTKATGEGTGLGLSLSYDIVTKGHGGTIEVDSQEGMGTTFTINIPTT